MCAADSARLLISSPGQILDRFGIVAQRSALDTPGLPRQAGANANALAVPTRLDRGRDPCSVLAQALALFPAHRFQQAIANVILLNTIFGRLLWDNGVFVSSIAATSTTPMVASS